ncbi:MAG: hypothetical protein K0S27_1530 [Gammaproteobacteria bacterium]|jgi:hypothetical protein|nr:hypothetical protein [Gammaproteobacteria bacterium]
MENLNTQLTRTCNACGIEKPLSAFLQLSGTDGTSYGKICSACRNTGKTQKSTSTVIDEERSTEPSGIGIRGKEKLYADAKREEKLHTLKELYKKEDIKKQTVADEKIERINLKEASEKKHREFYINPEKKSTLTLLGKRVPDSQQTQKIIHTRSASERHQALLETKKQQHTEIIKTISKEEAKKTTTDFNNLFHAIEPGKIEMQGELKRFFTWLGNSAPIVRTLTKGRGFINPTGPRKEPAVENSKSGTSPSSRRQRS